MKLEDRAKLHRQMLVIRRAEERLQKLFSDGHVPGFLHLSIGQEAVPVGVSQALTERDTVSSNHRGHGHTLAKGVDLKGFFAEILGKATGLCKGRGGSMHVADLSKGMLGANGIVGAGLPITTGSALALKMQGQGHVAVVYFGDGALAEGVLHECLNLAALWKLPILFVCENNGWSEFSPTERQLATSLDKLAKAFGIQYSAVDGNVVAEVAAASTRLVKAMRKTPAPAILECSTTRVRGHFEGDRQDYRDGDEIASLSERDPIRLSASAMAKAGGTPEMLAEIADAVDAEIEAATQAALEAPLPSSADILADVYTKVAG
ncbi:thiamine pyrophosphate-dependent dehydrogenase E1 component subunit alpha [Salipiger aestuarii]|uniref:Pyruvate dehydrogenase E1 component alpha subunit n=1 Tax=Salipiger aestuarii TaxID=568098 RepID=A0A327XGN4_9RHOB|nr:thiamine pyrophosphate-dependent dehydrogenase E1 component subunit alpha [Salipiger aestuarii]EIE52714.1 putative 2-oxo acid dehydrogenase alpha subunit [Citreicella sp. 357]KAA8606691.1 ABC transporter substrate-binding protein [Salipiger aestuarii]KAB2533475.1 ABC transporter substrate-binding protein [Salipiger aestuarii]RAK08188.1 pyruvate dehydrogenase E1 component alpha subunit [Salipiger aestuarii]